MTTALDLITPAMKKAGVLTKSEVPDDDEAQDALDALNDMLESWSLDTLLIYQKVDESFTLSGGTSTYTIGTGATFNTVAPLYINDAYVRSGTTDYPMCVITDDNYNNIATKNTQGIPEALNYDNGYETGTIKIHPVPSSDYTLFLTSEKPLASFTALSTDVTLQRGYKRAIIYNLALELASEYGVEVPPRVQMIASNSLNAIRRNNRRNNPIGASKFGVRPNIFTGYNQ